MIRTAGTPGRTEKKRARKAFAAVAWILAGFLSGCASAPDVSEPPPDVRIDSVRTEALDQNRTRFILALSVYNTGGATRDSLELSCGLRVCGIEAETETPGASFALGPGERRESTFVFEVDARELGGEVQEIDRMEELPWEADAELRAAGSRGTAVLASARAEGLYPRVREPELVIRSIVLVRHELINVLLELVLDVRNPNAFSVDFASAAYLFYGEGAKWARGQADKPVTIPPRGTAEVRLPIVLNFTETGRNLFDLVAKLKVVRYRLAGEARVTTNLSFLPEFRMNFDKIGSTQVERILQSVP